MSPAATRPAATRTVRLVVFVLCASIVACAGCNDGKFEADQTLGGVVVSKEVLNTGLKVYRRYCASCHGLEGEGKRMRGAEKSARDLRVGEYKYTSVANNGLPTDEDLLRTVRYGIRGTQMNAYDSLSDDDLAAVVHYVKTLSPRWDREKQGVAIPVHPDPWKTDKEGARARGEVVYHAITQCWQCHPSYASPADIRKWTDDYNKSTGSPPVKRLPLRGGMARSEWVSTSFGKVLPPDFLTDSLPAARGVEGLYRAISAGIGGTPMPTWHGKLSAQDLWAVVHYVRELVRLRGSPKAAIIRARVNMPDSGNDHPKAK